MTFRLGNPLSRKNVKQFDGEFVLAKSRDILGWWCEREQEDCQYTSHQPFIDGANHLSSYRRYVYDVLGAIVQRAANAWVVASSLNHLEYQASQGAFDQKLFS